MKKTTLTLFLFIGITFGYSQNYSSIEIDKEIAELVKKTTDTAHFDYMSGKEFDKPKLVFWVNNNLTGDVFSTDPNYSDNKMYSNFQKILEKGELSDFKKMCKSDNPSIRVYGFWALIKNKEYGKSEKIIQQKKNIKSNIYWNSSGCLIESISTSDLMKKLIERVKKYGS